jgi:hypothetical protein
MTRSLVLGLCLLGLARPAAADQCHTDRDCDGISCEGGACVDLKKKDAMTATDAGGEGATLETRRPWPWIIAGGATFVAAWIGTIALVGATAEHKSEAIGQAIVPVAGPILVDSHGNASDDVAGLLVGLMALQGAGLLTAVVSLTIESKVVVPGEPAPEQARVVLSPGGIGITASF